MVCVRHEEHQGTLHNINNSKEFWVLLEKMCLFKAAPLQRFLPVALKKKIFSSNSLRRHYSRISLALNYLLMSWDSALGHATCSTLLPCVTTAQAVLTGSTLLICIWQTSPTASSPLAGRASLLCVLHTGFSTTYWTRLKWSDELHFTWLISM